MVSNFSMTGRRSISLILAAATLAISPANAKMEQLDSVPIQGAAADCSEMQFAVQLADDVSMSYLVTAPTDGSDATMSVSMVFDVEAWVSLGFSPDDKGKMVGSEAVVGLPLEQVGPSNPGKYHMDSEKVEGVYLRDVSEQTLTDGNVWQEGGRTYLTFTKKLVEPGEVGINAEGLSYFLWAYGYENELGLHDKKTGAGAFILDLTPCVPTTGDSTADATIEPADPLPEIDIVAPEPEPEPVAAPVETPTADSEEPEESVDADNILDKDTIPEETDEGDVPEETAVDGCSTYQNKVQLDDKLSISYVVQGSTSGSNEEGHLTVKIEYDGEAWVSLAVAENRLGKMIGSEAVIALPSEPVGKNNPGEYRMTSTDNEGVILMDDAKQTLIDSTIVQVDGKTVVTFRKKLSEDDKLPIAGDGTNTFLWAYGYTNDLNLHRAMGSFSLTLSPCDENDALVAGEINESSAQSLSKYTAEERRRIWTAHAFLGLFAWAVFVPVAIAASWLRKLLQRWGGLWFKVHMYLNVFTFLFTIITFGLAVAMYNDANEDHFVGTHEAMGLAITLLVTLQAGNGIFRPPAPKKDDPNEEIPPAPPSSPPPTHVDVKQMHNGGSVEAGLVTSPPSEAGSQNEERKVGTNSPAKSTSSRRMVQARVAWEVLHKLAGVFLLFLGLWQVQSGIVLYSDKFGTKDYSPAFWGSMGGFAALVLMLTLYTKMRDIP